MGRGQTEVPILLLHFSEEEKESGSEKERSWLLQGEQGQANKATWGPAETTQKALPGGQAHIKHFVEYYPSFTVGGRAGPLPWLTVNVRAHFSQQQGILGRNLTLWLRAWVLRVRQNLESNPSYTTYRDV